jgi:hypothetical protein
MDRKEFEASQARIASLARIDDACQGLWQAEGDRAIALLANGFSDDEIAARILRDRPKLECLFKWDGKL